MNHADNTTEAKKAPWDETIKTILWALAIAMVFRSLLFEPFHIPSGSMKSNLLVGDYLFVSKYSYGYSRYSFPLGMEWFEGRKVFSNRPQRGEVVVFRQPKNPKLDFIKRVIGLPGDTVQMRLGELFINGKRVTKEYVDMYHDLDPVEGTDKMLARFVETLPEGKTITVLKETELGPANNTQIFTVPEGHYFMMGDNRDNSQDSRFSFAVGFVPEENIVGRAELILFSWSGGLRYDRFFTRIR